MHINFDAKDMYIDTGYNSRAQAGFGLLGIVLAITVLVIVGGGVYYLYTPFTSQQKNDSVREAGSSAASTGMTAGTSSTADTASGNDLAEVHDGAVTIQNFTFMPKEIRVKVGARVVWTNKDSVRHNTVSDTKAFEGPLLGQGESYEHIFDKAGTFPYFCTPHPNMRGIVIVE